MEARNRLAALLEDPSSFQNDPSYQFARDQGLEATSRSNSAMRGSGNALAALARYGSGLATQGYNARVDSLGRIAGQDQQYDLGLRSDANTRTRNANDFTLATDRNAIDRTRAANDFTIAGDRNANDRENNLFNYDIGMGSNYNNFQNNQNQYDLGLRRNAVDSYGAMTDRGRARSGDYFNQQRNALSFMGGR